MKMNRALTALVLTATIAGASAADGPVGWQELPNTTIKKVAPPNNFGGIKYDFSDHVGSVITAWGGAIADTKRNRMIIWGGGHSDYYGNEVYALELAGNPAKMTRLTDPSPWDFAASQQTNKDGTPVSRHTYNCLAYLPTEDRLFSFEGCTAPNGSGGAYTYTLDLAVNPPKWQLMTPCKGFDPLKQYGSVCGANCAYDPTSDSVICNWGSDFQFIRYTPNSNTWTKVTGYCDSVVPGASTSVIDPKRKLMFFIGETNKDKPKIVAVDISPGSKFKVQDWSSQVTGCDALAGVNYPGLAYDPDLDRIVGWPNTGDTVYLFNPDTKSCEALTYPNGPKTPGRAETFGRFRYFPALKAFAVVNAADKNAFLLRLPATLLAEAKK